MDSPCVASCKLNADKICVGCYRHIDEIVDWNKKNDAEHALVFIEISKRKLEFSKKLVTPQSFTAITAEEWQQAKQRLKQAKTNG